jgi:hypothetical protein
MLSVKETSHSTRSRSSIVKCALCFKEMRRYSVTGHYISNHPLEHDRRVKRGNGKAYYYWGVDFNEEM